MPNEKLDVNFVKKLQRGIEPDIAPGETAIEYLKRTEARRVSDMIMASEPPKQVEPTYIEPKLQSPAKPPVQEVVFYEGYKFNRDFLTCVALCMMKNPETNELLKTFGFDLKDLNGKLVVFEKPTKKTKKSKRK
jgi:hypothetical protein